MAAVRTTTTAPRARIAGVIAAVALAVALVGGCSGEGSDVSCNLNACDVTLNRGVDAQASILGVDVELVGVQNDTVNLKVGGNELAVPVGGGDASAEAGGLRFKVVEVTDNAVVMKVSRS
jgi:hypothetical protein